MPTGPVGAVTVVMVSVPLSAVTDAAPTGPLASDTVPLTDPLPPTRAASIPVSWSPSLTSSRRLWLPRPTLENTTW